MIAGSCIARACRISDWKDSRAASFQHMIKGDEIQFILPNE